MTQEIEIEYKTLLTKHDYETLLQTIFHKVAPIIQVNYYFETEDFRLKKFHSALRIREKNGAYTLTLKEPHPDGILETHDDLSKEELQQWLKGEAISKPNISRQLAAIGINENDFIYFGALETSRYSLKQNDILYVLDKSIYNGVTDYELEIEAPTQEKGEHALQNIIEKYHITKQQSITKIERFFRTLP